MVKAAIANKGRRAWIRNSYNKRRNKKKDMKMRKRILKCFTGLLIFGLVLTVRLVCLQTVQSADLTERADAQSEADRKIQVAARHGSLTETERYWLSVKWPSPYMRPDDDAVRYGRKG